MKWLKQLWCAMDGHGGVTPIDGSGEFRPDSLVRCKRCGAVTRMMKPTPVNRDGAQP